MGYEIVKNKVIVQTYIKATCKQDGNFDTGKQNLHSNMQSCKRIKEFL
jgi:hypothetical protein